MIDFIRTINEEKAPSHSLSAMFLLEVTAQQITGIW